MPPNTSLKNKKIIVMISGRGSNLQAIYQAILREQLEIEIELVISNKADALGLEFCKQNQIPHTIIPSKGKSREQFDAVLIQTLNQYHCDLIVLAGFMRILTADFIAAFPHKIINIHPSLLPKYKGLETHQRAIDAGDDIAGASVHVVTKDLDDGAVIAQISVPILPYDTAETLSNRLLPAEHQLYSEVIRLFAKEILSFEKGHIFYHQNLLHSPIQFNDHLTNSKN